MSGSRVLRLLSWAAVCLTVATPASAATVSIAWDPNPEPDIIGYNVFVSTQAGSFTSPIPVGKHTSVTIPGLQPGVQYYFAVQAQGPGGLSGLAQIAYVPPIPLPAGSEPTRSDFNADGKFDLLWQHQSTGRLVAWHMNGAAVVSSRSLTPSAVSANWMLRGSGDLNADGKPDLVWQNTVTGEIAFFLMNGTLAFRSGLFTPSKVDPRWQIASVRDIDRDGHPDFLWNNVNTGQVLVWYMNGTSVARQAWINAKPLDDTNWRLRGTADFTGDGQADLLLQHETTGKQAIWVMKDGVVLSTVPLTTPGTGDWKIMAIGDTNMDGHADLIFENVVTGGVAIWVMNGTTISSGVYVGTVDPAWRISAPR
jgi:Fibronectin type III domain/FG-GAP-like repeat